LREGSSPEGTRRSGGSVSVLARVESGPLLPDAPWLDYNKDTRAARYDRPTSAPDGAFALRGRIARGFTGKRSVRLGGAAGNGGTLIRAMVESYFLGDRRIYIDGMAAGLQFARPVLERGMMPWP
jgi:hypothetical protein